MKVIFGRDNRPLSLLIRLFTWSRYHHCGIVIGDDVIEATLKKGVIKRPLSEFKKKYKSFEVCEIPHVDGWEGRAISQIDKDYDLAAIFSIFFRLRWDSTEKWFCSELVAYASGIYRHDRMNRVTPEDIYKISKEA